MVVLRATGHIKERGKTMSISIIKRKLAVLIICVLVLVTLPVRTIRADKIGVDDFNVADQEVRDPPLNPPPQSSAVDYASAIGGERDMTITRTGGSNNVTARTGDTNDYMSYSQETLTYGTLAIVWDGDDGDPDNIDYSGLGSQDLTDTGTNTGFYVHLVENDKAFDLTITVWTDEDNWAYYTYNVPQLQSDVTLNMPFTSFSTGAGTLDWASVGAIRLYIDGSADTALDVTLDWITVDDDTPTAVTLSSMATHSAPADLTVVALATVGLVAVGGVSLLALSRRRKA